MSKYLIISIFFCTTYAVTAQDINYQIYKGKIYNTLLVNLSTGHEAGTYITNYKKIQKNQLYKIYSSDSVYVFDFIYSKSGQFNDLIKAHNNWPRYKGLAVSQYEQIDFKLKYKLKKKNINQKIYFAFRIYNVCKTRGHIYFIPLNNLGEFQVKEMEEFSDIIMPK